MSVFVYFEGVTIFDVIHDLIIMDCKLFKTLYTYYANWELYSPLESIKIHAAKKVFMHDLQVDDNKFFDMILEMVNPNKHIHVFSCYTLSYFDQFFLKKIANVSNIPNFLLLAFYK